MPWGSISTVRLVREKAESFIEIWTLHFCTLKLVFPSNSSYVEGIFEKIGSSIQSYRKNPFAFSFRQSSYSLAHSQQREGWTDVRSDDLRRVGLLESETWYADLLNEDFMLCNTYPKLHVLPKVISKQELLQIAQYRQGGRFPSCLWQHPINSKIFIFFSTCLSFN